MPLAPSGNRVAIAVTGIGLGAALLDASRDLVFWSRTDILS